MIQEGLERRKRRVAPGPRAPVPGPDAKGAYFFDVDGTLSEIAATPDDARVEPDLLDHLHALSRLTGGAVALVSGRTIADLDRLLGKVRLPVAGQHGGERRTKVGGIIRHPFPHERMEWLRRRVRDGIARHAGIVVEDKGSAIALHYRNAPRLAAYAHREARLLAKEFGQGISMLRGKAVVELLASGQDKGRAILDFMHETPFRGRRPVFVGDDVSDEPGFAMVNDLHGISVKVGPGRTQARWRFAGVSEVREWLKRAR
jgi:trehalose 6-phosphate phosphatase